MFGFIKNLVKKSDNNFFLELKEEVETKLEEAKKEIKEVIETKKTEAKQSDSNGVKPASSAKPVAEASSAKPAAEVVPAKPVATPDTNGKISRKDTAAAAKAAKIEASKAAKSTEVAKPLDSAQLIANATAKKQQPVAPDEKNFATKYLMTPSSNGRRRPGANMNSYMEMARQVKTPNK